MKTSQFKTGQDLVQYLIDQKTWALGEDNDGQIIIYTNFKETMERELVQIDDE